MKRGCKNKSISDDENQLFKQLIRLTIPCEDASIESFATYYQTQINELLSAASGDKLKYSEQQAKLKKLLQKICNEFLECSILYIQLYYVHIDDVWNFSHIDPSTLPDIQHHIINLQRLKSLTTTHLNMLYAIHLRNRQIYANNATLYCKSMIRALKAAEVFR